MPEVAPVTEEKPAGPVWTPGAHMFLRSEGRINPDFDGSRNTAPDVVKVLERARLQLGGVWGPVGVFVQAQDARAWGFEGSTISNEANTDLHQGWMELKGGVEERELSGSVRAGRQEISWGSQRLIGGLGWAPTARSFDALRLQGKAGRFSADAFVAVLAPPSEFSYTDGMDMVQVEQTRGTQLAAGLLAFAAHEALNIEAMVLSDFADASMAAPTRDHTIVDFGARLWGKPFGGLKYEAEGHAQVGHNGAAEHRAWAWAANLAYVQGKGRVKPGAKLGYAMASGSSCGGGYDPAGDCGSSDFFNFYPTNHMHYGLVDLMGWRNMRDLEIKGSVAIEWFKASLAYHFMQMQSPTGRWSNVGGKSVGAGFDANNVDRTLGHEFDLVAVLKPWKPLMIQPGYGLFLPRKAGALLGGADPQHFLYLWLVTNF